MIMRTGKWLWVVLALGVLVAVGMVVYQFWPSGKPSLYRSAKVEKGRLVATVSASGTLNAVTTVQVGSQVSGQLKEVLADFNAEVKAGQVVARLDPQTFEYRVNQAQADLDAARANALVQQAQVAQVRVNLLEARRVAERNAELVSKNFISSAELERTRATAQALEAQLNSVQAQVLNAQAVVRQREAALAQARVDLERTVIRAPVSGVVVKRSVEPGQTVAASLQAPELFIIARDLRDMQVEVAVDEADVGRIKPGQRVSFGVDAYAGRRFSGEVRQIRKAPQSAQNVVTYTVIVTAPNEDLSLLPGMTANVRVTTDMREQVLKVPNAALRFRPSEAESAPRARPSGRDAAVPSARVYTFNSAGQPQAISLKTGMSDGSFTEVLSGELQEGQELIVGLAQANASNNNNNAANRAPRLMF
jgi:HlyD family secretion protein